MKQIPSPPFWGGVRVKKWSPFFDSGAQSPIFGHLKMGTFGFRLMAEAFALDTHTGNMLWPKP